MDCSPSDSSVHGISQARMLEWVAISYLKGSSQPRDWIHVSCVSCIAGGFFLLGKFLLTFISMKEFTQNIIMITACSHCCLFNTKKKKLLKLHISSFCWILKLWEWLHLKKSVSPQLCPTLCNPMDYSLLVSVNGILQEEYWSGLPLPSSGDPPNPGIKPRSPALLVG